jgi:hypothetical protein
LLLYLLRVFLLSRDLWMCLWILLFFFRANRSMLVFFSLSSLLLLLLIINAVILPELMQQSCLISYSWDSSTFLVCVCVCVCVSGSRHFLLQSDTIVGDLQSKVRKECSWQKERVTACRQTDLQCATQTERERERLREGKFSCFSAARFFLTFLVSCSQVFMFCCRKCNNKQTLQAGLIIISWKFFCLSSDIIVVWKKKIFLADR